MVAEPSLPANPLAVELTFTHKRLWWHIDNEREERPEQHHVSADVWGLEVCAEEERHVADIDLVVADLTRVHDLLDAVALGEWVLEFVEDAVVDPAEGRLHRELEAKIQEGPAKMIILRRLVVTEPWQGHRLGPALLAGTLRAFASYARFAACRVAPRDFARQTADETSAELLSARLGAMLESIGFHAWRGIHIVDLQDPALVDARMELLAYWWPHGRCEHDQ